MLRGPSIVALAGIMTCAAACSLESQVRGELLTIAYRPMRIDSSLILQNVVRPGRVTVMLRVDSSGRTVSGSVRIEEPEDSALGVLAAEIAKQIVWDSATAARVAGDDVAVPFAFLVSVAGEAVLLDAESPSKPGAPGPLAYLISRTDSTSSATAEAVLTRPERVSGPQPWYPSWLQRAQVGGTVMVEATIDTLGRVEPGSGKIVSSSNHGFDRSALETIERSVFQVARTPWRAFRVQVHIPIAYAIKH